MKRKGNTTQLQVSIPKELMTDLKGLAKKEKRSTSNLVSLLLSGEMIDKAISIKEIPEDVHYKFKIACMKNRIEMRVAIIEFMRTYDTRNEVLINCRNYIQAVGEANIDYADYDLLKKIEDTIKA